MISWLAIFAGACTGHIDGPKPEEPDLASAPLRRLSRAELRDTLVDLIPHAPPSTELLSELPSDAFSGFDNDATNQSASEQLIVAVNGLVEDVATRAATASAEGQAWIGCEAATLGTRACLEDFVRRFGRRAWRRPLTAEEIAAYGETFMPLATQPASDFYTAIRYATAALLQDVEFLYVVQVGEPSGGALRHLDGYEVVTRMAFLLWGVGPDDVLLDLAATDAVRTSAGRRELALAMLDSPKARASVSKFHGQWLGYAGAVPTTYGVPATIKAKLLAEVDAMIDRVVFEQRSSWFDLFQLDESYLDDELATWYGDVPAPGSSTARWTPFGDSRRGILSTGAFLTIGAKFVDTSPTQRGYQTRLRLLCKHVPLPDGDLDIDIDSPPPPVGNCKHDAYRAVLATPACAGCHAQMDLIGFGLERYDSAGRFRTTEPDPACAIDGQGSITLADGVHAFSGPAELASLLGDSDDIRSCMAEKLLSYTLARTTSSDDAASIAAMQAAAKIRGDRFDEMLLQLVSATSFTTRIVD